MATRIISTKLVLEGEAEYKAQLKNVNNELALQKSELEKVRSQYSGADKSMESLTAQLRATQGVYEAQHKQLELISSRLEQARSAEASYAAQVRSGRSALESSRAQLMALQASTEDTTQAERALIEQIKAQEKALSDAETMQQKAANAVTAYETELNKAESSLNKVNQALTENKKALASLGLESFISSFQSAGSALNKAGNTLTTGVTVPLAAAGAAAVNYASDTQESINKVEVAFSYAAEGVKKWSDTTLTAYGLAKGTALDMAALFGDMATSMGYSHAEAADLSMELVGLAADLASFKNISIDEAQTALKSIFTGETESLKNLGVVMTEANLQAYALAEGFAKMVNSRPNSEVQDIFREYASFELSDEELNALNHCKDYKNSPIPESERGDEALASLYSDALNGFMAKLITEHTCIGFTTGGHTGEEVFLAAYHPEGTLPIGMNTNIEINAYLCALFGLKHDKLDELSDQNFARHTDVFKNYQCEIIPAADEKSNPTLVVKNKKKQLTITPFTNIVKMGKKGKEEIRLHSVIVYVDKNNTFYLPQELAGYLE